MSIPPLIGYTDRWSARAGGRIEVKVSCASAKYRADLVRIRSADPNPAGYLDVFFTSSPASGQAGQEALGRIYGRTVDVDEFPSWSSRMAQYDAVCDWGVPNHSALQRVSAISHPVFIANGDSDPMIPPHLSHLLAGLIPQAKIKIYPDAAHGFLFQHASDFAADVNEFLNDSGSTDTEPPAASVSDV